MQELTHMGAGTELVMDCIWLEGKLPNSCRGEVGLNKGEPVVPLEKRPGVHSSDVPARNRPAAAAAVAEVMALRWMRGLRWVVKPATFTCWRLGRRGRRMRVDALDLWLPNLVTRFGERRVGNCMLRIGLGKRKKKPPEEISVRKSTALIPIVRTLHGSDEI